MQLRTVENAIFPAWLAAFALAAFSAAAAKADDGSALRLQQQAQEQSRGIAHALVAEVLDVQIRQLEENGLTGLAMYREVKEMRANLAALTDDQMEVIARLLAEAEQAPAGERPARLNAIREKLREVTSRLIAERQRLYRRMQVARLSEQVRELIALQAKAHDTTRAVAQQSSSDRERLALQLIEDQADVQAFYLQLVAALDDAGGAGGKAATGALDGLRVLRAAQVESDLVAAGSHLQRANFSAAAERQQSALKGLAVLAERLNEAQGLSGTDRDMALRLVRELRLRQERLRQETTPPGLAANVVQALLEQQTALHKDLGKLAAALTKFPAAEPLLEQAKAASYEATAALFEQQSPAASAAQARAVTSLAQMEVLLQNAAGSSRDQSADELAAAVARLEELRQALSEAERKQAVASAAAAEQPQAATEPQADVEQALRALLEQGEWASVIVVRLDQALDKVAVAGKSLTEARATADLRQNLADQAHAALKLVQGEVDVQLADARRRQKAVEVGELARAAEALERASSAERTMIRHLQLAAAQGLPPEQAEILLAETADVGAVAERIAAGVASTAPNVAPMLQELEPELAAAANAIRAASNQPEVFALGALGRASTAAQAAANKLSEAAAVVRAAQGRAARDLAILAETQLSAAAIVREAVDQAGSMAGEHGLKELAKFASEREKRNQTAIARARAEGRDGDAAALELFHAIEEIVARQRLAEELATDWTSGLANDPLEAASAQQAVADSAREQAQAASPELAAMLDGAALAAAEAARQILIGNPANANSFRATAEDHLAQAQQAVETQARQVLGDAGDELEQSRQALAAAQNRELKRQAEVVRQLRDRAAAVDASAAAALEQAQRLAERGAPAARLPAVFAKLQQRFQQAAGNLAAREQQLGQDHELAGILSDLAAEQQTARDAIAKAGAELEAAAADSTAADRIAAAQALQQAQQQFAAAQMATGRRGGGR
jgi:hypothetical protein